MSRILSLLVASSFLASQALACGMYIPPEKELKLADLFEQIDQAEAVKPAVEVAPEVVVAIAPDVQPSVDAVIAEAVVALDAVVPANEGRKAKKKQRKNKLGVLPATVLATTVSV